MTSSLAAQLAQGASLNSGLLVDRSRRKYAESYLFTGREADHHDLHSLHSLGLNALIQLKSLNPAFRSFEDSLFSDAAKSTDRTLLSKDSAAELDVNISKFTRLLGPFLMDVPAGKALEWLVRRFRINEFNVDDILSLFLPYHESPHFAKMVTILHIKPQSRWHFLLAHKSAAKNISRPALVTEMLRNSELTRFILSLLPESINLGLSYRTLIAFHTSTMLDYIARSKSLDEQTVVFLLPPLLEVLQSSRASANVHAPKDAILSSYILLSALSQKLSFSQKALRAILTAVAKSSEEGLSIKHIINTILSICAPQSLLEKIPSSVINVLVVSSDFADVLVEAFSWAGSEKFGVPLLVNLVSRLSDPSVYDVVDSILASQNVPTIILSAATRALLQNVISEAGPSSSDQAQKLLGKVHLRYPDLLQNTSGDLMDENGDLKEKIEQTVLSLSLMNLGVLAHGGGSSKIIVATTDADSGVRTAAVRKLLETLSSTELDSTERAESQAALLARISDPSVSVISPIYLHPNDILSFLDESFLDLVKDVLCSVHSPPTRQIVRLHLAFLTHHFVSKFPNLTGRVVNECLWSFLMFSKPKYKTAATVWDILSSEGCSEEILKHELLGGCLDAVRWERGENQQALDGEDVADGHLDLDKMAKIDLALANQIAENILHSNNYSTHFEFLLCKLQDQNSFSRSFGYLVVRVLLSRLSGSNQIDAALRVLDVMGLDTLEGIDDFTSGSKNLHLFLHDMSLSSCVVLKPSSNATINKLKISIVAMVSIIPRSLNAEFDWFGNKGSADTGGAHYVDLMHRIYSLANSTSSLHAISTHLLRAQFMSLKDEALTFLARVWTSHLPFLATSQDDREFQLQQAALHHASAFLIAHHSAQNFVDFQTILPSILCALQSSSQNVREAAVECVLLIDRLCEAEKPTAIYGFDLIYGESSRQLQYLEWDDLRKFVRTAVEHRHNFANDPSYIQVFQRQYLMRQKSDKKKDSAYKRRIICYLLSHVNACSEPTVKLGLLKSLEEVSDLSKIQMLLPLIEAASSTPPPRTLITSFGPLFEDFVALLLSSFDSSAAKALNDTEGRAWHCFVGKLVSLGPHGDLLRKNLERGLFDHLKFERQVEICHVLLDLGISKAEATLHCKSALSNALHDAPLVLQLLKTLRPLAKESVPPVTKRARLDMSQGETTSTETLGQLTLLAEVLSSTKNLEGSGALISGLLDTLNGVVHCGESDVAYLEQLLMSALEHLTNNMDTVDIMPSAIKLDVLVEIIRVSDNPQTFHEALLLMSSFARLAPEAVLRNIMPVFTFMGSNVFHRDDTYSHKVVQKTIDSIVPVMVASLKGTHLSLLDLHITSRDFLTIFTDAVNHIPRHRRTSFFTHFVEVLGPDQYLAPVCMLLVDKVANRVVRQSAADTQNSFAIALSLIQHYPSDVQVEVLIQVVQESRRIVSNVKNPDKLEPIFLNDIIEDDGASVALKRRAQALLMFADNALRQLQPISFKIGSRFSELVQLLLEFHSIDDAQHEIEKITASSQACLTSLLNILPAVEFVSSILTLIEKPDNMVKMGALNLFGDRLPKMTDKVRSETTTSVKHIIQHLRDVISADASQTLILSALKALKAIGDTVCAGEENAVNDTVPLVMSLIERRESVEPAMSVLASIILELGPRIIPHFRGIVQECVRIALEKLKAAEQHSSTVVTNSLLVIQGLLSTIPSFWSAEEITPVANLYILYGTSTGAMLSNLVKSMTKRVTSSVLLPTLCELWSFSSMVNDKDAGRVTSFFNLLKKSLHAAPRSEVLQHLRSLFNVFMQAFTWHSTSATDNDKAVKQTIAAFLELVVKLNDTAFKPLFRKLYDWAFTDEPETKKQVVFCNLYIALLDYFKGLMTPYMLYMTNSFIDVLKGFSKSTITDHNLWFCTIKTLAKTFEIDEGGFWRDEKLRPLVTPLVEQIPTCVTLIIATNDRDRHHHHHHSEDAKSLLAECISGFAKTVTDDDNNLLKNLNLQILMQTRSEDPKQQIFALECAQSLWKTTGERLLGFVTETVTFIAELAEDENDTVVRETRKLKIVVERVAGRIDGL